jgi:spore germination protein GerM
VAAVALASCGVPEAGLTTIEPAELPDALRPSTTTIDPRSDRPGPGDGIAVYWIRDDQLVAATTSVEVAPELPDIVAALERGPGPADHRGAERSAVSRGDVVEGVTQEDAQVTIELDDAFAEVAGSDQVLALGQIVMTLTSLPTVGSVVFRQGDRPVDVPLPDGTLVRRPVLRGDYVSLVAPADESSVAEDGATTR